jgi:hypothetical protein
MMEVLTHDIMRYEALSEQCDIFALASTLSGNAPNDQYTVIELNVPAVPQVAQLTPIDKENIEPLPGMPKKVISRLSQTKTMISF